MIFKSEEETYNWALQFAKELKVGDKVALYGNLGAGKTVISRGICKGLGFDGILPVAFRGTGARIIFLGRLYRGIPMQNS